MPSYRFNTVQRLSAASNLQPAASYTVQAYEPGAQVVSVAGTPSTFTVRAGHGFAAGDKFLLRPGTDNLFSGTDVVASVTATTVVMTSGTYTAAAGDYLANLGNDTGTASPNFDGDALVTIYSDMGATQAITSSALTTNSDGEYFYWHNGPRIWELVRSGSTVVAVLPDASENRYRASYGPLFVTGYDFSSQVDTARVPLLFEEPDGTDLFSVSPMDVSDQYSIILRVGDRAHASGDSRKLGYFSATIVDPGAVESQALYGINQYNGAATAVQVGVHGISLCAPGAAATQAAIVGVQARGTLNDTAGGTVTALYGISSIANTSTVGAISGTVTSAFGVYSGVNLNAGAPTFTSGYSFFGEKPRVAGGTGTIANAQTAFFRQPTDGTTTNYALVLAADSAVDIVQAFKRSGGTYQTFYWSEANSAFWLSNSLALGNNTDADRNLTFDTSTANGIITYLGASAVNEFSVNKPVRVTGEIRAGGDTAGLASHTSLTNTNNVAANSTGVGTILFKGTTSRNSTGFIKIYVGTTAYYVPFFDAITG